MAANAGAVAAGGIDSTIWRVLLAATLLGGVGLADDLLTLGAGLRVGCQVLAAAVVLSAGVRFQLTASPIADGAISLVWMVGITNAFDLLDNMDGLCGGTAALAGLGMAAVALAAGQVALAVTALAVTGACLGFLAFNLHPATIFMGDAGSMFLGAAIAAISLAAHPLGSASVRLIVPLLIMGLPLLDAISVTLGRARRGKSIMVGDRDNLSHRLVKLGRTRSQAVWLLLLAELASVAAAVVVDRGYSNPWVALAVTAVPLGVIWRWTSHAAMYEEPIVGLPVAARWAVLAGGILVVVISGPAIWAMARVRAPLQAGASAAHAGILDEEAGRAASARQDFARAAASFTTAKQRLGAFGVGAGRVVPVVAANLRAARVLATVGLELSESGSQLAADGDVQSLRIQRGTVPLDTVTRLAARLKSLDGQLTRSSREVHRLPRTVLLPQVRRAVDDLDTKLTRVAREVHQSSTAAAIAPAILGGNRPRRYLLLFQNNSEARATGGLIGNFGELVIDGGRISLGRFGRGAELDAPLGSRRFSAPADYLARYGQFSPFDLWQNLNMSPDFPTVAALAADLYPLSSGQPVDGVIGVDPIALSNLLRLTGPIKVASWPDAVTADNVVQVTLLQAYDVLAQDPRIAFLGQVAQATFEAMVSHDLGNPVQVVQALGPAVAGRNLQIYMKDPAEQAFVAQIGASGAVGPITGDQWLVTTQNASANKVDYYLQRRVDYEIHLSPRGDAQNDADARVSGKISVHLTNNAPAAGHSPGALGPYDSRFLAGENRTFLSVYTPLNVASASLDGVAMNLPPARELGENVVSTFVSLPPGATRTFSIQVDGVIRLASQGSYVLQLPRQPVLGADQITVSILVPAGWEIEAGGDGWARRVKLSLSTAAPTSVRLRLRATGFDAWLAPLPEPTGRRSAACPPVCER